MQISAGSMVHQHGKLQFVKVVDHIIFSFQPAPIGKYQTSGRPLSEPMY